MRDRSRASFYALGCDSLYPTPRTDSIVNDASRCVNFLRRNDIYTSRLFDSNSLLSPHALSIRFSFVATKLGYSKRYLNSSNSLPVRLIEPFA